MRLQSGVCCCWILFILTGLARAEEKQWRVLLGNDGDLSAWKTDVAKWVNAESVGLNSENDRRLRVVKPGKGVFLNGLTGRGRNLVTKETFQDVEIHVELMISKGSNAGVKMNGVYEIQILDSYGKPVEKLTGSDMGGVYPRAANKPKYHTIDKGVPPKVNAAKPAGEWQTLEIKFTAPRFDESGKKTKNAKFVRVVLNGKVIHENVDAKWPTGAVWNRTKEKPKGPILLQADHGPIAYRNVRVRSLSSE